MYAYGDLLSQNEIHAIVEQKTGERLELTQVRITVPESSLEPLIRGQKSADEIRAARKAIKEAVAADPTNIANEYKLVWSSVR
jgi:hypothetical protein